MIDFILLLPIAFLIGFLIVCFLWNLRQLLSLTAKNVYNGRNGNGYQPLKKISKKYKLPIINNFSIANVPIEPTPPPPPEPPPCRVLKDYGWAMCETKESKEATRRWNERVCG